MRLSKACSLWGLMTTMAALPLARGDVCFMLYQMADNDLESFIRADLQEYYTSDMIKDPTTTTWVYFDHRNGAETPLFEDSRIENTSPVVLDQGDGSYYYTYDHDQQDLVIDSDLGELNSDLPQTVYDFATKALGACKAAGSTEYFIAFSSHGSGFDGFGGDENVRRLTGSQSNQDIASALRNALNDHGMDKFDVVGFDACLMMAYGALDDFKSVAKYYLASEEVEPGHGWSYSGLTAQPALDTARYIVSSFVNDLQGGDQHETPKQLGIVDTTKFETFTTAWDRLSNEIKYLIEASDAEVAIAFNRARSTVYSFASVVDDDNAKDKANIDMFGLIEGFERLCKPKADTNLATLVETAKTAYADMFVERQTGPNTPTALTGMHVFFPSRSKYQTKDGEDWDKMLFNDGVTATTSSPEWLNLLRAYYSSSTPSAGGSTVCDTSSGTTDTASGEDLLANVTLSGSPTGGLEFQANVARSVDDMFVEYGINLTPLISSRRNRRQLNRLGSKQQAQEHPRYKARRANRGRRLEEESDDYLYFYCGDIIGEFSGSEYIAYWPGDFFALGDSVAGYKDIYVFDNGEGSKETPVVYFPSSKFVTENDVAGYSSFEDAEAAGGVYGYLSFSENNMINGMISSGISLYTNSGIGDTFSEVPRVSGGQIVPINFADASVDGKIFDYFLGGFFGDNIVDWNPDTDVTINLIRSVDYKNEMGGESFTLDAIAADDDTGTTTVVLFEVDDDGTIIDNSTDTYIDVNNTRTTTSGVQHIGATLAIGIAAVVAFLF